MYAYVPDRYVYTKMKLFTFSLSLSLSLFSYYLSTYLISHVSMSFAEGFTLPYNQPAIEATQDTKGNSGYYETANAL